MILIFGGTTEGIKVSQLLDFMGEPYFYSTKLQTEHKVEGKQIHGSMDKRAITDFCRAEGIKLIIDAAHPFAANIHNNIHRTATALGITTIRYDRANLNTQNNQTVSFFHSFADVSKKAQESKFNRILTLTGVNTIPVLEDLWKNKTCYFRILQRAESYRKAISSGLPDEYIISSSPSDNHHDIIELARQKNIELIISKDSGKSGFLETKIKAAEILGIPIWIVKRPPLPTLNYTVTTEKAFIKLIYQLRKNVLKQESSLRSGFSTGTCVTAAAKACFIALIEGKFPVKTQVTLPDGETTEHLIFPKHVNGDQSACTVIKDAGDDADITHAKEIGCEISLDKNQEQGIEFKQGAGVGRATIQGLPIDVGEPAINPVPRKMIKEALHLVADKYGINQKIVVTPFVPEGKKLAEKTFNSRVGIVEGISILGTTGKVTPYSEDAFVAAIKNQLSIIKQTGYNEIVLTSGKRSEKSLKDKFQHLPDFAFIHFGNLVGKTLELVNQYKIPKVNLGLMFGKSIKLAEGHLDTHSKKVNFNPLFASEIAEKCGYTKNVTNQIKQQVLANAIFEIIPYSEDSCYYVNVAKLCYQHCKKVLFAENAFTFILLTEKGGNIFYPREEN